MFSFKTIFFLIFAVNLCIISAQISDLRLCIDEKCSEQVGEGRTLIRYSSPDRKVLSFAPNTLVKIFSHGAGTLPMYIGVEINGKRGYVNKNHIRETRIFKKPTLLLPTETEFVDVGSQIQADAVKQEYEIIDGTKIPIDSNFVSSTPASEPVSSSSEPILASEQQNNRKTEDLVLDLNKKESFIKSSQVTDEKVTQQPEIVPKVSEEPIKENLIKSNQIVDEKIVQQSKPLEESNNKVDTGKNIEKEEKPQTESSKIIEEAVNKEITKNEGNLDKKEDQQQSKPLEESNNKVDTGKNIEKEEKPQTESSKIIEETVNKESTKNEENLDKKEDQDQEEDDESDEENDDEEEEDGNEDDENEKGFFDQIVDEFQKYTKVDDNTAKPTNNKEAEANKDNIEPIKQVVDVPNSETSKEDFKIAEPNSEIEVDKDSSEITVNKEDKIQESETSTTQNPLKNVEDKEVKVVLDNDIQDKEDISKSTLKGNEDPTLSSNKIESEKQDGSVNQQLEVLPPLAEKESVLKEDKVDVESTTIPFTFDEDVAPIQDMVTPDPLSIVNTDKVSLENQDQEVAVENNSRIEEDKEEKPAEPVKPSDLGGFGSFGMGLFGQPKESTGTEEIAAGKVEENPKINEDIGAGNENISEQVVDTSNGKENVIGNDSSESLQDNVVSNSADTNPSSRPNLGPNEPTFIDVTPPKEEPKKVLLDDDLEDNNGTEEYKISEQDLKITSEHAILPGENSGGIFSSITSYFGVNSNEEVKQEEPVGSPLYEEAIKNSDKVKEIVEEPFIKTEAYVTGDTNPIVNNVDNLPKTEDNVIKTIDTQNLAADRSSEFSYTNQVPSYSEEKVENVWSSSHEHCDTEQCYKQENFSSSSVPTFSIELILQSFSSDMFLYLLTTSVSVVIFLFLYIVVDKCKREAPLIARINKLEQELLATKKENQMLQELDSTLVVQQQSKTIVKGVPNEIVEELTAQLKELQCAKEGLEEQVAALEKELDNSTEVGIELNRIITDMLNSTDGSEILKENVEQMQKRLLEQQDTINTINENLNLKDTENYELRLELEISNKKVCDLQGEVDKMIERIVKIEEERDAQQNASEEKERDIEVYQLKIKEATERECVRNNEMQVLRTQLSEYQKVAELKIKEYNTLKESLNEIKSVKNNKDTIKSLLEVTEIKAQLEQFRSENTKYSDQLRSEQESNVAYSKQIQALSQEVVELRSNYEKADKDKFEIKTKLEVLNNYFKEKEEQMQKEISKYESLWAVKEGEASSTTERFRLIQEELQNYKAQNESLKQEIMNQEVELKSQISVLEKKAHESWMTIRQTERKLEEARQEAAQLRNRLTMKERAAMEGNIQMRMQSPLHQNGELPLSSPPLDATLSPPPPLIGNPRDLTMSPPIPGMPPLPFLPPPPGGMPPFMPPPPGGLPPPGMPPFMPPPIFPGDHRPPPLGRMSSPPPLNSRYSPESTIYSEYDRYDDRNTPSPIYDSEYGTSPPARAYSPYEERLRDERLRGDRRDFRRDEDRREYNRPHGRSNGRTSKGISSGSENELGKFNRKPNKKV